jgi:hypothetical protein
MYTYAFRKRLGSKIIHNIHVLQSTEWHCFLLIRAQVQMLDWGPAVLIAIFCNIPQSFQANTRTTIHIVMILVTIQGVWIGNRIYWTLTTLNYKLLSLFTHFTNTIWHTRSSQSLTVFTSCCLVGVSNGGHSPSSGFPNYLRPQLPAHNSNSSQWLSPSSSLTTRHRPHRKRRFTFTPLLCSCLLGWPHDRYSATA